MKTRLLPLFFLLGFTLTAEAQVYDLWLFDGVGPAPTAVTSKGFAGLSSATVQATATTTNAGYIYRQTNWANKWTNAVNTVNTAMTFSSAGGSGSPDGRFSVTLGKYYTFNVPTTPLVGNTSQLFSILETSSAPVTISSVTRDIISPAPTDAPLITVNLSAAPGADQFVYLRYTTDAWSTSTPLLVPITGTSGSVTIPAQSEGTVVSYYALTTPVTSSSWGANIDVLTLKANNNAGTNYNYTSATAADTTPPSTISDLTATADADLARITLSWTPATEDNFDTYEIFYNLTGSVSDVDSKFDKNQFIALGTRTSNSVTLTGLSWGSTYYFKIRGVDQATNKATLSNEVSASTIAEPLIIMDGLFDGESKWGAPVAIADGVAGWFDVNAKKMYVTHDANYVYLGAEVDYASWQKWVFLINTISGAGGSVSAASDVATYAHSQLPDFAIVQNGLNANLKTWDGSAWVDHATLLTEDVWTKFTTTFVEVRILQSMIGNVTSGDVQFYISGNNAGEHSSFDSVPDDSSMAAWNDPLSLSKYATSVTLPVELASFTGKWINGNVLLNWATATETNNFGFEIQKRIAEPEALEGSASGISNQDPSRASGSRSEWETIGFVAGKGTTTEAQSYSFSSPVTSPLSPALYRLKQIDLDGTTTFSQSIEVSGGNKPAVFSTRNYPNPFNPSTTIEFTLTESQPVHFELFNIIGQRIMSKSLGRMDAGLHSWSMDGSFLASGFYTYRLTAGNQSTTRMIQLIR
ncbi:MAG: T9SS type A sorting domain-containing protein [Bacteroidetes bacterium]|nr:T9SS type A sorting domain-containing protein [Bacteroidota bacterium]